MNRNVVGAIFKRNFFAYFNNPTGYVFICLFVVLSSLAAFWPNDFFNANLDNLDQLNRGLPFILLVFIPAITMSIWAEERRAGTDELLLTIPAGDFDVVLGKYLAAVAIYTVALVFSMVCSFVTLRLLGNPDVGLFLATYFGYWLVGIAMLAIGMVASFLTGNLTVGFVLGAVFNAPLVFATFADVILPTGWVVPGWWPHIFGQPGDVWYPATAVRNWSIAEQFRDFGRGVIALANVAYFGAIVAISLYVSMVLISRRHWQGRRQAENMAFHYSLRSVLLVIMAFGLVLLCEYRSLRADVSSEQLSSLSPQTRQLVRDLQPKHTVHIDAYVSSEDVPESYVQTRLNLLAMLSEFGALNSNKIQVQVHNTEPLSEEADRAEKLFGITARNVVSRTQGVIKAGELYMGVALTCGLNKVVIPFFDYGTPVEYELVRSIATVAEQTRKKVGVLVTDAKLFGGFDQASMSPTQNQPIIDELEKQYDVKQVSADQPITEKYDVLLAVQPSSLAPEQMNNFVACVRSGQPTAIFEDPLPLTPGVPGTDAPRQPPQQNPFMGRQPPLPKGDITQLWKSLGVTLPGGLVVWQQYNPYPRLSYFPPEFVFVNRDLHAAEKVGGWVFNPDDAITKGLHELLFLFPGSIRQSNTSSLTFKKLTVTGVDTGVVNADEVMNRSMFGGGGLNPRRRWLPMHEEYVLAAHITGTLKAAAMPMSDQQPEVNQLSQAQPGGLPPGHPPVGTAPGRGVPGQPVAGVKPAAKPVDAKINVVLVADIDCIYRDFFEIRNQAGDPNRGDFNLNPDNVTFAFNALDSLAGDDRFIPIRTRRPMHRTLERVEAATQRAREDFVTNRDTFVKDYEDALAKIEAQFKKELEDLQKRQNVDPQQMLIEAQMIQERHNRLLQVKRDQLQKERDLKTRDIERKLTLTVRGVQNGYKLWALLLPPIAPLLIGLAVLVNRRAGEREGVARSRLR